MPAIPMMQVESQRIAAIGHDAATRTMSVQFARSLSIYQYFDVSAEFVEEFLAAESKGRFFEARVRGVFRYEKQETPAGPEAMPEAPQPAG